MAGWKTARLDEIEVIDDGRSPFRPVRHHFDISSFGVIGFTGRAAGDRLINEHDEADDGQEELYLVHAGRARFELDGDSLDAPAGTFVYVEPGVKRTAFAEEPGTTLVALGGVPGKSFVVHGFELWAPLQQLYQAGEYERAAERGRELLASDPPYGGVYYNVACCESLAGRRDDAISHLRRAIEMSEQYRSLAEGDTDLDPIRDEPAFKDLVGSA
jgi:tetratricopeptide (TPR) repeat protein